LPAWHPKAAKADPKGGYMDPALKALCIEVLDGDVDGDEFATLLMETGVDLDDFEWNVASRLLERGDVMNFLTRRYGYTLQ